MNLKIAIQGIQGSNHHQVSLDYFGSEIDLAECLSFDALVQNLLDKTADKGVMAIENSITKSEKMKSGGSIMQALRESGQVVPGLFSSSPAAMFHLSARKHLQTSSAIKEEGGAPEFNGDGVTENLLKSLMYLT